MGNVTAAKPKVGGALYVAPTGTTLPTDATTALNAAFKAMGYASEDGLTNSNSPESEDIKAWGGDTVLSVQTARDDKWSLKLIEALNIEVLKLIYGDSNVTAASASAPLTVKAGASDLGSHSFVFEMVTSDGKAKRVVIPEGKITEIGDIVYADAEATGFEITITAVPDATACTHYEYIGTTTSNG